ncbi:MAG: hypothetical protein U9R28_06295 [Pseudomonadota bacterium]|nr:hypothetical protein [Pseudomonadota bacterium]
MELGSTEHKQKLMQGILRVAFKTATIGLFIGVFLMTPALIIPNSFSMGLAYAGFAIILGSQVFASILAWRKYKTIIKPFDETYRSKND